MANESSYDTPTNCLRPLLHTLPDRAPLLLNLWDSRVRERLHEKGQAASVKRGRLTLLFLLNSASSSTSPYTSL